MISYINKTGLLLSALSSLLLTLILFFDMAQGLLAIIFIAVGVSAELAKYFTIYQASVTHHAEKKIQTMFYVCVTALLIMVSLSASAAALLIEKRYHYYKLSKVGRIKLRILISK